jgi:single-stranded DNA-binding protein
MSGIECAFFGALGRDAEPKTSKAGKPCLRLNVRVGDGDDAQWVSVLSFDERAIDVTDKFVAGARVYVEGKLSTSEWTDKEGKLRFGLSAMSWHCRMSQIGRNKTRERDKERYASPRSAPAGRLPASGNDLDDEIGF